MRLLEILIPPNKRPLFELAMNQRTYQQIISQYGDKINVGYEFEFTVPEDSPLFGDITEMQNNASTREISRLDLEDILNLFELIRRTAGTRDVEDAFMNIYHDEIRTRAEQYAEDNWEDFDEEDEDEGKEQAKEYYEDEKAPGLVDFFDQEYGNSKIKIANLIDEINIEPLYGYTDDFQDEIYIEDPDGGVDDPDHVIDTLIGTVEADLEEYGLSFDRVTADGSVTWPGIEVITSPEDINTAVETLQQMFKWMRRNNVQVDRSAGLHINISIENIEQLDPVKLAVFLGDEYSLGVFSRLESHYAQSQIQHIVRQLQQNKIDFGDTFDQVVQTLSELLKKHKYGSFNLEKLVRGYIEFRTVGGVDYHKDESQVLEMLYRFATAMVVATDPQAYRQQYIKKVSKLLQRGDESKPVAHLPKGIAELDKHTTSDISDWYRDYLKASKTNENTAAVALVEFLIAIVNATTNTGKRLGFQDIQFLRKMYKQHQQLVDQKITSRPKHVAEQIYALLRLQTQKKQQTDTTMQ